MGWVRAIVAVLFLAGCGSALPEPATVEPPREAYRPVPYPPPPARPEFVPEAPSETAVWIDGEWRWRGSRWAWVYGRWVEPPEGARFAPWSWKRDEEGQLYYAPGKWWSERGERVAHPEPLKLANADEGDVLVETGTIADVGRNTGPEERRWRGPPPSPCADAPDAGTASTPSVDDGAE